MAIAGNQWTSGLRGRARRSIGTARVAPLPHQPGKPVHRIEMPGGKKRLVQAGSPRYRVYEGRCVTASAAYSIRCLGKVPGGGGKPVLPTTPADNTRRGSMLGDAR
jgi:hypothetical protein